jgi:sugar/nucleoside kinase (ribokinase family)
LLYDCKEIEITFAGAVGTDRNGEFITRTIEKNNISTDRYKVVTGDSPVTYVLSDPHFNDGNGERTFINDIAAAWEFGPDDLDDGFFQGDILLFGATGLVPHLHDGLTELLRRGKELDRTTVVTTVYDFRSEKRNPVGRWPLGSSDESYRYIDLLITDREEALRLSGTASTEAAAAFFTSRGVGAFIITSGPDPIRYYSRGTLFPRCAGALPVSAEVGRRLKNFTGKGDTTGCGDNFAGGVIAYLGVQRRTASKAIDLPSACALGIAAGGFACFYLGGTFHERYPGEKREAVAPIYEAYRIQLDNRERIVPFDGLF